MSLHYVILSIVCGTNVGGDMCQTSACYQQWQWHATWQRCDTSVLWVLQRRPSNAVSDSFPLHSASVNVRSFCSIQQESNYYCKHPLRARTRRAGTLAGSELSPYRRFTESTQRTCCKQPLRCQVHSVLYWAAASAAAELLCILERQLPTVTEAVSRCADTQHWAVWYILCWVWQHCDKAWPGSGVVSTARDVPSVSVQWPRVTSGNCVHPLSGLTFDAEYHRRHHQIASSMSSLACHHSLLQPQEPVSLLTKVHVTFTEVFTE